jgi:hypothetical protein
VNFDVFGPFEIPRNEAKTLVDVTRLGEVRKAAEEARSGLSVARGCYVFVIRAGLGFTPWYVGQTNKLTFIKEAFGNHKIIKYNNVLNKTHGVPMVFFIPIITAGGNTFCKQGVGLASIKFLEKWLIAKALEKNSDLLNSSNTKFVRELHVRGIFNATKGEATSPSMELRRALWT